jgi:phage shock protein PspC (stress-responsive transcriptional regulator)
MNDTDTTIETPAEEHPSAPRRLVRFPDRGPVAGVAEGLGVYFGLDPVIFRIAFVVLLFAGGGGLLLYAVGWIAMPEASDEEVAAAPAAPPSSVDTRQWAGYALIAVAVILLVSNPFTTVGFPLWAVALIVVGVLLFQADRNRAPRDRSATPAPPAPTAPAGAAAPSPPPPAAPPSPLGRITAGTALLATGFAALLAAAGAVSMGVTEYLALLLVVVGVGLATSTWWGRARGLIGAGLVLLALLVVNVAAGQAVHIGGGVGERTWTPSAAADVDPSYELFAGEGVLDLSNAEIDDDTAVSAGVTFGSLTVILPDDLAVRVDAALTGGEIDLLGERVAGMGVEHSVTVPGPRGTPELHLDLRAVFGEIIVRYPR